jgi:hypothetical protein
VGTSILTASGSTTAKPVHRPTKPTKRAEAKVGAGAMLPVTGDILPLAAVPQILFNQFVHMLHAPVHHVVGDFTHAVVEVFLLVKQDQPAIERSIK